MTYELTTLDERYSKLSVTSYVTRIRVVAIHSNWLLIFRVIQFRVEYSSRIGDLDIGKFILFLQSTHLNWIRLLKILFKLYVNLCSS